MEKLIPIVNRVQDALGMFEHHEGISFPRLVVVGSQSSGKSSVLESIVGRDFLPRGSNIVTRRPLILQLEHQPGAQESGIFEHKPGVVFRDFSDIKKERLLGNQACISDQPIKLKISSNNMVDITLVDLPGMTRIAVKDQPHDIPEQIKRMIMGYIRDPNTLILAISPANQDIAISDALKLASEVDPHGDRTIGVLTKIDLMDRGTDAVDMILGKQHPLALGYIGIICRSQGDIYNRKNMQDHLIDESNFFKNHEKYRQYAHRMGTHYLTITLNNVLKKHIIKTLPGMKKKIHEMIRAKELELKSLGAPIDGNTDFQGVVLLNIITSFSNLYCKMIEGRNASTAITEINGGAQIRNILFRKFLKQLNDLNPFDGLSEQDVRTAILNSQGIRSAYMVPQDALEILIRVQIHKLRQPCLNVLQEILDISKEFMRKIALPEYMIFPNLHQHLLHVVDEVLEACNKDAHYFITESILNELDFINFDHPSLIKLDEVMRKVEIEYSDSKKANTEQNTQSKSWLFSRSESKQVRAPDIGTEKDMRDMIFAKCIVVSYFNIIKKNIGDYTSKAIMTFLVGKSMGKIQNELLARLYSKERFAEILYESPEIPQRRTATIELLNSLKKASSILDEIRDIGF